MDFLLTVLTGGATGLLGSIFGKLFSFADAWIAEKKADADHKRTIEMHKLQHDLRAAELETEREIVLEQASADLRRASYSHDQSVGRSSRWVVNILRLVRPTLTAILIALVWYIYIRSDDLAQQESIIQSVIYMASSAVLWWFGDRAMAQKK